MKTTKKDIEKAIKKQYNISNEDAQAIVEAFFATINELATQENGVLVQNIGKFEIWWIKIGLLLGNYNVQIFVHFLL